MKNYIAVLLILFSFGFMPIKAGVISGEDTGYTCLGTTVESYTTEDAGSALRYDEARSGIGQSFLTTEAGNRCTITVKLVKVGSPTGNIWVSLWSDTPTLLYTSASVDVSTISGTATEYTFTFAEKPSVTDATTYRLLITGDWTIDATNYVNVRAQATGAYAGGAEYYWNGSTWTAQALDAYFKVNK